MARTGIVRLIVGRCNQAVHAAYSTDAHLRFSLPSSPFPRRDHQSLRLVVFSLRPELPRCRRNVSDARCCTQRMRRSEHGALSSVRLMQTAYATSLLDLATGGTSTKCSSRLTDACITSGVQLIRTATPWTSWSKVREISERPRNSFASY